MIKMKSLEQMTLDFLKELRDHHGYDIPECFVIHELIEAWEEILE
jgi:uncharacterized protein involved in tolerance to divalent cations